MLPGHSRWSIEDEKRSAFRYTDRAATLHVEEPGTSFSFVHISCTPFREAQGVFVSLFLNVSLKLFPASFNASPMPWIAWVAALIVLAILAA